MEYQMRNWYYFNWLCGDLIVEQTVHSIDLVNWAKGDHPIEAHGMGGRQVRVGPEYGEIYDHHAVEYTYGDGAKMFLFCRHIPNCWTSGGGVAHGAKGEADLGKCLLSVRGQEPVRFERGVAGHQQEHNDLFAALDAGRVYHEGDPRPDGHVLGPSREVGRCDEIGNGPRPETLCVGCRGADCTGSRSPLCLCDAGQDETILMEAES
jgi:predicted dehydrogenase